MKRMMMTSLVVLLSIFYVKAEPGGTYTLTGNEKGVSEIIKADMKQFPELYKGESLSRYISKFKRENKIGKRKLSSGDQLRFPETFASIRAKKKPKVEKEEANALESADVLSEEHLISFFDTVTFTGTNLVLKFKDSGGRYSYSIDGEESKMSNYGETIIVPVGSFLKLVHRHGSLTLKTLPDEVRGCGFEAMTRFSWNGKVSRERAYLVFEPGGSGRIKVLPPSVEAIKALGYTKEELNFIEPTPVISEEELLSYFDAITFTGTNLVVKFKERKKGPVRYSIDDERQKKTSNYSEVITVPVGSRFRVCHARGILTLSTLPDEVRGYGFDVEIVNRFSSKEAVRLKKAYLAFEPQGNGNQDEEKSERIKGLRLLRPSVEAVKALGYK